MSRNRSCGKRKFAAGIIFGSIVGGITALLFAPKSGEKIRKELAKKYCDMSDKTCEMFDDVCQQTTELVEKAKDVAHCAKEAAQKIYRRD